MIRQSPRYLLMLTAAACATAMSGPAIARGANLIADASFEAGASGRSPAWTDSGTGPYPSALCTISGALACQDGDLTAGPRTGGVWAWFGGSGAPQTQTLSQDVHFPEGSAILSLHLWIGAAHGQGDEALTVAIDGSPVFIVNGQQPGFSGGYQEVTRDASAFGDGQTHKVSLAYVNPTGAPPPVSPLDPDPTTNINVDDVSLTIPVHVKPIIRLLVKPKRRTKRRRARFQWQANEPGVAFECKLDRKKFSSCITGRRYTRLKPGRHAFTVRGTDLDGNASDPVTYRWRQRRAPGN